MAVTNQQIIDYLLANPNLSDAQIVSTMEQNGISPSQMAAAVGIPEGQISARVAATVPPGNSVTLGDTVIVPQYQTTGSGMDQQIGALESFATSKSNGDPNYKAPVGTPMQIYSADGEFVNTVKTKKDQSFFGGLVDALKDPVVQAAVLGVAGGAGVFDGLLGGGAGATAATEAATAFDLANAGIAGGAASFTPAQLALIEAGASAAEVAAAGGTAAGLLSSAATTPTAVTPTSLTSAAVTPVAGAVTPAATSSGLLSTALPAAGTLGGALTSGALSSLGGAAATGLLGGAITGGLGLAGGVLQQQTSKDAAQTAAQNVEKATQQAVEASQFRPVGMTTRFGTSNYTYDPVTGRMTSAGYQLSPEAKAAQDRLVGLAGQGLTQAEQAQQQFAPLQTAAQNLYSLGSQYIAKSPEEAAQDYINKQMQLLAPSREVDLANLQNRLFQQGRTGVSVAQGGTLGATTPELQALYNARAMQDLQLASQAQQEGRANTLFGSNLYDLGTAKLSNYYGGQTQAYAPYTTALGQVQNLESLAQQPLQMGASLGQQSATAGANAGRIGLTGAQISGNLMTSPAVTNNPYAAFLSGLGSPTSTLGQGLANWVTGTGYAPPSLFSAVGGGGFGTGNVFGNQDLGSYL
jgi:hypothetical protein